jgi:uncharacterized membrane protein affecting hemolysin expression
MEHIYPLRPVSCHVVVVQLILLLNVKHVINGHLRINYEMEHVSVIVLLVNSMKMQLYHVDYAIIIASVALTHLLLAIHVGLLTFTFNFRV